MKRYALLLVCLLLVALVGCRKTEIDPGPGPQVDPPPEIVEPVPEEPLVLDTLTVEISRNGLDAQTLMTAVKELPPLLEQAFGETNVEIGQIRVTVGASPADTARALAEGRIHLGFLPAEGFLVSGGTAQVLFADAREQDPGFLRGGSNALICAAPTEYGAQLAARLEGQTPLSWAELTNAHWGVLEPASLEGYRCLDLWLADNYEGKRLTDLPEVTAYDSYEALFRAAAAGEIDALVLRNDARMDVAEVWALDMTRTGPGGMRGFDREDTVWNELPVLATTAYLYRSVAAVAAEEALTDGRFALALEQVLQQLAEEAPEQMPLLGAAQFASVADEELDPMRRLVTMEG